VDIVLYFDLPCVMNALAHCRKGGYTLWVHPVAILAYQLGFNFCLPSDFMHTRVLKYLQRGVGFLLTELFTFRSAPAAHYGSTYIAVFSNHDLVNNVHLHDAIEHSAAQASQHTNREVQTNQFMPLQEVIDAVRGLHVTEGFVVSARFLRYNLLHDNPEDLVVFQ
jgi:hypothetical protein